MALPDLIAALEREAEQQAETIRAEAVLEGAALVAAAQAGAAAQQQSAVCALEVVLEAEAQRALIQARRAARARWLEARAQLLARVRAAILAQLDDGMSLPAYRAQLPAQLERAWQYVEGSVVVYCAPSIEPAIRSYAAGRPLTTVVADAKVGHGFCIRGGAGAFEISHTLEDAATLAWPELAIEIMRSIAEAA